MKKIKPTCSQENATMNSDNRRSIPYVQAALRIVSYIEFFIIIIIKFIYFRICDHSIFCIILFHVNCINGMCI